MNNNTTNSVATLIGTVLGVVVSVSIEYMFTKKACKDAILEVKKEEAKQSREDVE